MSSKNLWLLCVEGDELADAFQKTMQLYGTSQTNVVNRIHPMKNIIEYHQIHSLYKERDQRQTSRLILYAAG